MVTKFNDEILPKQLYSAQDLSKLIAFGITILENDRILAWNKMNSHLDELDFYKMQQEASEYYA